MDILDKALVARALADPGAAPEIPSKAKKPQHENWRKVASSLKLHVDNDSSSPIIRPMDRALLNSVFPLHTIRNLALCPHCGRPLLAEVIELHVQECAKAPVKRRMSLSGTNETPISPASSISVASTPQIGGVETDQALAKKTQNSKKRKSAAASVVQHNGDSGRKKARNKANARAPRAKAAFNIDRQCGVLLPNGQPCARSLTCKAHSMGAKRAVKGRSAPYDTLLQNYQRENMVKMASINTARELAEAADSEPDEPLNPEKEFQQVMEGVRYTQYIPCERKVLVPSRTRAHNFRLREMMALALLPRELNGSGDAIFGRALAFCSESPQTLQFVRAPAQRYYAARQRAALQARQQAQQQQQQQHHESQRN